MTKSTYINLSDLGLDTVVNAVYERIEQGYVEIDGLYITHNGKTMDYVDYIHNYIQDRVAIYIAQEITDDEMTETEHNISAYREMKGKPTGVSRDQAEEILQQGETNGSQAKV